ncbi:hypothetical protein GOP47_0003059 [Adiantum capillus-veneris]|uniref:Uncharacterized protein n=1 Tax=Adiantum capillus-veneris TaxID=13818 RepID=A0A9D4VCT6_ADICA|nr:hypothetical protein GOP47_0003059 [Adiantum capillus-veneris]
MYVSVANRDYQLCTNDMLGSPRALILLLCKRATPMITTSSSRGPPNEKSSNNKLKVTKGRRWTYVIGDGCD